MPATRSVLLKLDVRPAGRLSHCSRNKSHAIRKGEVKFIVKEPGPGTPEQGYCGGCAATMLEKAVADIASLQEKLAILQNPRIAGVAPVRAETA